MTSKESLKESTKIFKEAIQLFEEISQIPENHDWTVLLPTPIQVKIGLLLGKTKKLKS